MCEYRAFDKTGVIIDQRDLVDTDSAVAWGITIMVKGAALIERKSGERLGVLPGVRAGPRGQTRRRQFLSASPEGGRSALDDDHVQVARAVDALDPVELDVAGGRRAADPGQRPVGVEQGDGVGTSATTWSARTMQTCRSGTRVIARRPWPGPWSSTIVPVSAMPTRQPR